MKYKKRATAKKGAPLAVALPIRDSALHNAVILVGHHSQEPRSAAELMQTVKMFEIYLATGEVPETPEIEVPPIEIPNPV